MASLFRRRSELSPPNVARDWASSGEWREWESPRNVIAGESFNQPALKKLAGAKRPRPGGYLVPVEVWLVREPTNEYDGNAFRAEVDGTLVGHLRREVAAQLAGPADKGRCKRFAVCGVLRGGWDAGSDLGCHVWLDRRVCDGPVIHFGDDTWTVNWPPFDDEGTQTGLASEPRRA